MVPLKLKRSYWDNKENIENYQTSKMHFVQELSDDFCERLIDISNDDRKFAANLVFSTTATFGIMEQLSSITLGIDHIKNIIGLVNIWLEFFQNRLIDRFFHRKTDW